MRESTPTATAILSISSPGVSFGDDDAAAELSRHVHEFAATVGATLPVVVDRIELFRSLLPGSHGRPASMLTTRQQLQRFWYDLAGTPYPAAAAALVEVVGTDRLLYGSDYCWTPAVMAAQHAAALDGRETDWRAVTTANAARLLG